MKKTYILFVIGAAAVSLLSCSSQPVGVPVTPLAQAHAHNDYRHNRPLHDALAHGFTGVEADIFLVDGDLFVAHDRHEITPERTLRRLYLDPLRARAVKNGGRVYRDGPQVTLLIDFKSEAVPTYRALHRILAEYRDLISDRWTAHFKWRGIGEMPAEEHRKLREIVQVSHEKGRRVRFWATPDKPLPAREAVWRELVAAGVDLINTDDLQGLQRFLLSNSME